MRKHSIDDCRIVIYLINLLLLSAMLVIASPRITFASFGEDMVRNTGKLLAFDRHALRAL